MKNRLSQISFSILLISASLVFLGCNKDEEPRFTMPVEVTVFFPAEFNTIEDPYSGDFWCSQSAKYSIRSKWYDGRSGYKHSGGRGQLIPVSPNVQYQFMNNVIVNVSPINSQTDINEMYYNDFIEFDHSGNLELLSSISELKETMINGVFGFTSKIQPKAKSARNNRT